MKRTITKGTIAAIVVFTIISCTANDNMDSFDEFKDKKDVSFDVLISKEGRIGTRGEGGYDNMVTEYDMEAKLDPNKPFGLMGVDANSHAVLINNARVFEQGGIRAASFNSKSWYSTETILLSADFF